MGKGSKHSLDIEEGRHFFVRLAKPCHRLPREVVDSPSLQVFEMRQDVSELSNVIYLSCALRSYKPLVPYSILIYSFSSFQGEMILDAKLKDDFTLCQSWLLTLRILYK